MLFKKIRKHKQGIVVIGNNTAVYSEEKNLFEDVSKLSFNQIILDITTKNYATIRIKNFVEKNAIIIIIGEPTHSSKECNILYYLTKKVGISISDKTISSLIGAPFKKNQAFLPNSLSNMSIKSKSSDGIVCSKSSCRLTNLAMNSFFGSFKIIREFSDVENTIKRKSRIYTNDPGIKTYSDFQKIERKKRNKNCYFKLVDYKKISSGEVKINSGSRTIRFWDIEETLQKPWLTNFLKSNKHSKISLENELLIIIDGTIDKIPIEKSLYKTKLETKYKSDIIRNFPSLFQSLYSIYYISTFDKKQCSDIINNKILSIMDYEILEFSLTRTLANPEYCLIRSLSEITSIQAQIYCNISQLMDETNKKYHECLQSCENYGLSISTIRKHYHKVEQILEWKILSILNKQESEYLFVTCRTILRCLLKAKEDTITTISK